MELVLPLPVRMHRQGRDSNHELVDKGLTSYKAAGIEAKGYVCDVTDEDAVIRTNALITVHTLLLRVG